MPHRLHILDLIPSEIEQHVEAMGFKPYRAKQLIAWIYKKFASSFDEMTDLPKGLRRALNENFVLTRLGLTTLERQKSDNSKRYLWGLNGALIAESVLLEYRYGSTACLSTQIGCPVKCEFCASGKLGFERNLRTGEISDQLLGMCVESGKRINRVVFMGTGEPFFNYEAVMGAINILSDPGTYDLSRKRVTVSTVGIPGAIRQFAEDAHGVRLAVSLHGSSDKVRNKLIPVNRIYPLGEVMASARYFARVTGQRITFEYVLLKGVNDSIEDAERLSRLVSDVDCLVNLIAWNPVPGIGFDRSGPEA